MRELTLGSFFDGIGGWQIAAVHNGVKPIWSSEIDEFPAGVTKHWFPETKQLGDITKLTVDDLDYVDICCAGSPCQDLSVAGKRAGLGERTDNLEEATRSGLFRVSTDLVHAMRRKSGGRYPRWYVWENVCGCLSSSNGHDFQAVLEEITESKIPMPSSGKWARAGMVRVGECLVEWRVLNAQYFGVAQRRQRLFLITDFAASKRIGERQVLFEQQGVPGNFTPGGGKEQDFAGKAGESSESTSTSLFGNSFKDNPLTTDGRSV